VKTAEEKGIKAKSDMDVIEKTEYESSKSYYGLRM